MKSLLVLFCLFCLVLIVGCSSSKPTDSDAALKKDLAETKELVNASKAKLEKAMADADEAKRPVNSTGHLQSMKALDAMVEAGKSGNSGGVDLVTADKFADHAATTSVKVRTGEAAVQEVRGQYIATLSMEKAELFAGVNGLSQAKAERDEARKLVYELDAKMQAAETAKHKAEHDKLVKAKEEAVKEAAKLAAKVKALESTPPKVVERIIERPIVVPGPAPAVVVPAPVPAPPTVVIPPPPKDPVPTGSTWRGYGPASSSYSGAEACPTCSPVLFRRRG